MLIVGAALMGAALSVRDLVTERPIYRRQHAVDLHPPAHLTSTVLVLGSLVAGQSVLFTLLATWGIRGPDDALVLTSGRLELAVVVAAVAVTMTVGALAVSAAARSVDQTMPALVGPVVAQLIFCGGLSALAGRTILEQASWLLPARFGHAAGAATIGLRPSDAPDADPLRSDGAAVADRHGRDGAADGGLGGRGRSAPVEVGAADRPSLTGLGRRGRTGVQSAGAAASWPSSHQQLREVPMYRAPTTPPASAPVARSVLFSAVLAFASAASAFGAMAIARLVIGSMAVKQLKVGRLEIDELTVRRLNVVEKA